MRKTKNKWARWKADQNWSILKFISLPAFIRDIINNQNQMIKLVFGSKNKIVKLDKVEYKALQALIRQSFPDAPVDYTLSYLDQDRDEISLGSDEDLRILMSSGLKINKIYVKQSLSQVIEVTDQIQPSFEIYESTSKKVEIEEVQFKVKDHFSKEQNKVSEVIVVQKPSQEKKSIEVSVPVEEYHSADEREQVQGNKKPQKVEAVIAQPMLSEPKLPLEIIKNQDQERSEHSKSFILSMPDTNKIQIDEATFNERIHETVKKLLQQEKGQEKKEEKKQEKIQEKKEEKKQILKPEAPIENKQIFEVEKQKLRPKIFEEKKESKKFHFENELIYHGVICSNCKDQYGIIGVRYQCIFCEEYNLCSTCEESIEHEHPLLKVKLPKQTFRKEQIIEKYRKEMYSNILAPGHYVPSISKDEAKKYIQTSKEMVKQSMERAQKMIDDMFLKLEMSHKNPYELQKPIHVPAETMRDKMNHLINLFGLEQREARYFCEVHKVATKEELAEIYIRKKTR